MTAKNYRCIEYTLSQAPKAVHIKYIYIITSVQEEFLLVRDTLRNGASTDRQPCSAHVVSECEQRARRPRRWRSSAAARRIPLPVVRKKGRQDLDRRSPGLDEADWVRGRSGGVAIARPRLGLRALIARYLIGAGRRGGHTGPRTQGAGGSGAKLRRHPGLLLGRGWGAPTAEAAGEGAAQAEEYQEAGRGCGGDVYNVEGEEGRLRGWGGGGQGGGQLHSEGGSRDHVNGCAGERCLSDRFGGEEWGEGVHHRVGLLLIAHADAGRDAHRDQTVQRLLVPRRTRAGCRARRHRHADAGRGHACGRPDG
eukprot:scaffold5329_cov112-Isochrysis_galbana.AAC.8